MTTIANYAFSSLAVSAKLHRLLHRVGVHKHQEKAREFDAALASAVGTIAPKTSAHRAELHKLRAELSFLEEYYREYREKTSVSVEMSRRFEQLFAALRDKIEEKLGDA